MVVIAILVIIYNGEKKNLLQNHSGLDYFEKEICIIFYFIRIVQNFQELHLEAVA